MYCLKLPFLVDLLQSIEYYARVYIVNLWCDVIMGIRTRSVLEILDLLILGLDILVLLLNLSLQVLDLLAGFVELSGLVISLSEAATFSRNVLEGSSLAVAPGRGGKPRLEQKALVKRLERLV